MRSSEECPHLFVASVEGFSSSFLFYLQIPPSLDLNVHKFYTISQATFSLLSRPSQPFSTPSPTRRRNCGCHVRSPKKSRSVQPPRSAVLMRHNWLDTIKKHSCLRVSKPLGRPVLASEEVRFPNRNKVLPDATNDVETEFPLKVLAVGAPRKH